MYRKHDLYKDEKSWLRDMEDYEFRQDMLTAYEELGAEVCVQSRRCNCPPLSSIYVCRP